MKGIKSISLMVLVDIVALVASAALAEPQDGSYSPVEQASYSRGVSQSNYSGAFTSKYNAEDPTTVPPIFDVLILRPLFVVAGAGTTAAWAAQVPFIALTGLDNVATSYKVGPGQAWRAVFVDPVGSH